jgi:SNF2 family DNA or RNA helicase
MQFKPYSYQLYNIKRVITDKILALWLDMGLGKTVITLTAINDLKYNRFSVSRCLVVAPKKVAQGTWSNEAQKWDHLRHLRVITVLGTVAQRVRALNAPGDIWIMNRDNVVWLVDYYKNAWPFDMVVLDEASSFKNHQAKRVKALTWVRHSINRLVELTGTPAPNGLVDLWAQIYLLDEGERLGRKVTHYRERYFHYDVDAHRYYPKSGTETAVHKALSDICVSMKAEDYLELPECITVDVPVMLDDKAKKAYKTLEKQMLLEVDENTIDAGSAAVLANKLLQLCNGAVYGENHDAVEVHDCKLEAFMELVEGLNGKSALVFYNFKHDLSRIKKALAGSGLRVRELKGPQDENAWNNRQIDILLAHPASCAYGLNLQQGGNHVIWFGLNWSLELYQQANKRLHRQGQAEKVIIHRLVVPGGVDEDVTAALEGKGAMQDRLLSALKARIENARGDAA